MKMPKIEWKLFITVIFLFIVVLGIVSTKGAIPHLNIEGDSKMSSQFIIGNSTLTNCPVYISQEEMNRHWAIAGISGRGKSRFLEQIVRQHLRAAHGGLILDPHGFLYEDILAYVASHGYRDRIIAINVNETDYSVGLNFLDNSWLDDAALASQIMKGIAKVFGQNEGDTLPRLERWQRSLLISLIQAKLTLADMLDFLSTSNPVYRRSALEYVNNPYVIDEWNGFDSLKKRSDMENLIEAPLNRAAKLILSDPIRRIIGQTESTFNIGKAIEEKKIILVNLAPRRVSRECQQILGILLIDQVINYAFQRTQKQARKPFYVIVDEAAELTSNDLPYALQAMRKFGIFFTLCFQTLTQAKKIPGYYENLMSNTDVKIAFKTSRDDAEELIGELFAGRMTGNIVKEELYRTLLIPHETTREVVTAGSSYSESRGESDSSGDSVGDSFGSGSSSGFGDGYSEHLIPGESSFLSDDQISYTSSMSFSSALNEFGLNSSASFSGHSNSKSLSSGRSESRSVVPFHEYIREQELANRQYYTIEEIREKYIAWVMCQPMRHAQIRIGDKKAIPIITTLVEEARAREKDKRKLIERSNQKYALPSAEVDRLIENRRIALLEKPKKDAIRLEEEIENDRWQ